MDPPNTDPHFLYEVDAPLAAASYFDFPFPSDARLTPDGRPDLAAWPNPEGSSILNEFLETAQLRAGFSVMPVAFMRASAEIPAVPARPLTLADGIVLVDIDPASPQRGRLVPIVAEALPVDDISGRNLLAIAPVPGVVLRASTRYGVVVTQAAMPGFVAAPALRAALEGQPTGRALALASATADLVAALAPHGLTAETVVAATTFTTGDQPAVVHARSETVRAAHDAVIADLAIDPDDGASHPDFCELIGTVRLPQFQRGTPPFDTEGELILDANGAPVMQGELVVPVVINLPNREMPAAGWPLYQFFHGSGGRSSSLVDSGYQPAADVDADPGTGPAMVVARHGIASVSAALPVNPERLPGADDIAYLNLGNLSAFPSTFQQGVFEQRLLLDALLELELAPSSVAACAGVTLPVGATAHRFDPAGLVAGGQSMGGMYTNMIGAVEPRFGALVPTGAGGMWPYMILDTELVPGARGLIAILLGADGETLSYLHPGLALMGMAWEQAEPMVFMARLHRAPLDGFPARHVYEPVGFGDEYFPTSVFDAAALAYGNQQVGEAVWPSLQTSLALDGLDGFASYPVTANRVAGDGSMVTAVVVQHAGDGIVDEHYLYRQIEEIKHQYGCFLATYLQDGVPTVPALGPLTAPCL